MNNRGRFSGGGGIGCDYSSPIISHCLLTQMQETIAYNPAPHVLMKVNEDMRWELMELMKAGYLGADPARI